MSNSRGTGFVVIVSAAVVIALFLIGMLVVILNNQSTTAADDPADVSAGAVTVGDGPVEVEVWFDYYCPHCQQFEAIYGEAIGDLVDDGAITLELRPVALPSLNAASGTEFSARSGGALLCVAEQSATAALEFHEELFELRPSGQGLDDAALTELAEGTGADGVAECISARTHMDVPVEQTSQLPLSPEGGSGTPTLVIDGEFIQVTGDVQADLLDRVG